MTKTIARALIVMACALLMASAAFALGEKAPAFSLKDASGKPYSMSQYVGKKAVLMSFWASWCKPCILEMPMLEKLYGRYKGEGLEILSINTDNSSGLAKARQIVKRKRITYPVLYDTDSKVTGLYNPKSVFPFVVLIDKAGKIQYTHEGFAAGDEIELEKEIEKAIGNK
jgi:peroxiredoxin